MQCIINFPPTGWILRLELMHICSKIYLDSIFQKKKKQKIAWNLNNPYFILCHVCHLCLIFNIHIIIFFSVLFTQCWVCPLTDMIVGMVMCPAANSQNTLSGMLGILETCLKLGMPNTCGKILLRLTNVQFKSFPSFLNLKIRYFFFLRPSYDAHYSGDYQAGVNYAVGTFQTALSQCPMENGVVYDK